MCGSQLLDGHWDGLQLKSSLTTIMGWTLNRDEAYVGRIKREFNLRSTAKARALYDSNRAYWENLYGDDPVTSPNHPASPPKSLLPRQPSSIDPGYSFLEPEPT